MVLRHLRQHRATDPIFRHRWNYHILSSWLQIPTWRQGIWASSLGWPGISQTPIFLKISQLPKEHPLTSLKGGLAEYVVSEEKYLARMPEWKHDTSLAFEYAASLPRAALTAWQALKIQMGGVVKPGMSESSQNFLSHLHDKLDIRVFCLGLLQIYSKVNTVDLVRN